MDADLKDSLDVAISLGSVINTLWQFFLTVIVAIVAGLLFSKRQLNPNQQKVATIAFLLFAGFNLLILYSTYEVFNAALDEVRAQAENVGTAAFESESLSEELRTIAKAPSWVPIIAHAWLPIVVHIVVDAGVVFLIWSNSLRN